MCTVPTAPLPTPLYPTDALRAIERAALAAVPEGTLMERAGAAAADATLRLLGSVARRRILVLAGPGNNGGDALVVARLLARHGATISVALLADESRQPADARRALDACRVAGVRFVPFSDAAGSSDWALVIDGLFGIGLQRPLGGAAADMVQAVNALRCPVLALDVPSGLDAETGNVVGAASGRAIIATETITFLADKPGLHTAAGRDHAGKVTVADLGIDPALLPPSSLHLSRIGAFQAALRKRTHNSHKGSYGDVAIVGGAPGMAGAALLAARAAAHHGAGRVYVAMLEPALPCDPLHPELMLRDAEGVDLSKATVVAGPGLGQSAQALALLERAIDAPQPLLLDADALNLLATHPALQKRVARRDGTTLITPHPLEAARLLGSSAAQVQATRVECAIEIARRLCCVVLLKGSGTVIAAADGQAMINTTGNAGLASAGSGDVLAGICGALLAQGWSPWHAALGGAWLHGSAADELVQEGSGPIGLTAGELIPRSRAILNRITQAYA